MAAGLLGHRLFRKPDSVHSRTTCRAPLCRGGLDYLPRNARNTAIYALTPRGAELARALGRALAGVKVFVHKRMELVEAGEELFGSLPSALAANWDRFQGHLVVETSESAVRALAPTIDQGDFEPAVVAIDPQDLAAVVLLGGPAGEGHRLAQAAARTVGGYAVHARAPVHEGLPGLESLAAAQGLRIQNASALSLVQQALVEDETVVIYDPQEHLWPVLKYWAPLFRLAARAPGQAQSDDPLIWVSHEKGPTYAGWLVMRPSCLAVGLHCQRRAPAAEITWMIASAFEDAGLSSSSIMCLAAPDSQRDIPGLAAAAKRIGAPLRFFGEAELRRQGRGGGQGIWGLVRRESLCEAAALMAAEHGELIVPRRDLEGVSLAVALAVAEPAAVAEAGAA